jgi:hypothetical protein
MIISHKHRFIFVKTAKTAGTSIETFLSPFCGESDVLTPFGREEPGHRARNHAGFYNHMPGFEVRSHVPADVWNGYFKFCVERNPWDKALSHYYFVIKRFSIDLSLDEYLASGKTCINYPKYTEPSDPDKIIVDRVVQYEKISSELMEIFESLGIPFNGDLGIRAKGQYRVDRRPYQEVLSHSQRDIIAETYAQEIKLFGFEFSESGNGN